MKDLFNNYHRQKALSHLWILAISWVLAVSVNMFVLGGSSGDALKANIKELQTQEVNQQDVIISQDLDTISIMNTQSMDSVVQFGISFAYNQDLLQLWDTQSKIPVATISKIETTPWFSSFIVVFDQPTNISENSTILDITFTRNSDETIHFNPININFTDVSENSYDLSSSSLIF